MFNTRNLHLRIPGVALAGAGLLIDMLAGFAALQNDVARSAPLHAVAIVIWAAGIALWGGPDAPRTASEAFSWILRPEVAVAAVIALILFPGLGTLACSFACGMRRLPAMQTRRAKTSDEAAPPDQLAEIRAWLRSAPAPQERMQAYPLDEVILTADAQSKRAALDQICAESGPQGIPLARRLLADPDPDVRALAALAVSQLEADFSQRLAVALDALEAAPHNVECHMLIGQHCLEYARISASTRTDQPYLLQARKHLEQAISLDPARRDALLHLAEVLAALDDPQAWQAASRAIAEHPTDSGGYLIGMAVAFARRRFDQVVALALQAHSALPEYDTTLPLIKWWLEALSPAGGRLQ